MRQITEGKAKIQAYTGKISKKLPVFYNPLMKLNRDLSILLLNSIDKKNMQIAEIMAGTGIRGVRFLLELDKGKIQSLDMNDHSGEACTQIKKNLNLNKVEASVFNEDASKFLLASKGYEYIDIDPFGSPNSSLDAATKRIARDGILAITATDTAPLAGTYPKTCLRKYWARPMRNELMHEIGIRILIRKVQLIGAQYDKAMMPIFPYSTDHYYRVFFRCKKGKQKVDEVLKEHKYLLYCTKCCQIKISKHNIGFCCEKRMEHAGPLYTGRLWDRKLVRKMKKKADPENKKMRWLLDMISKEMLVDGAGFYDIHTFCKKNKISPIPKMEKITKNLKNYSRTHFSQYGLRVEMDSTELYNILQDLR